MSRGVVAAWIVVLAPLGRPIRHRKRSLGFLGAALHFGAASVVPGVFAHIDNEGMVPKSAQIGLAVLRQGWDDGDHEAHVKKGIAHLEPPEWQRTHSNWLKSGKSTL